MSRRDALIKAAVRAHSPDYFDMTKLRQRSVADGQVVRAGRQDMLGAMAYASNDWTCLDEHGEPVTGEGNPLNQALLVLKYHAPRSKEAFERAHALLMHRHVGAEGSHFMYAVATAALFEWVFDRCPACCGGKKAGKYEREEPKVKASPFRLCQECGNTRRANWQIKERWKCVAEFLRDLNEQRFENHRRESARAKFHGLPRPFLEPRYQGMSFEDFRKRWHSRYLRFLEILRLADKRITRSLDIQVSRLENSDIEPRRVLVDEPAVEREQRPEQKENAEAASVLQDGGAKP